MAYENNHYVPQGILRRFGKKIHVYDLKEEKLQLNSETYNIFSKHKLYSEELEKKFNSLESKFVSFVDKYNKAQDKVLIKRNQIWMIKQFLLISMLRVDAVKNSMDVEKSFAKN